MPTMYLIRGVPGSGKTTLAKTIYFNLREKGKKPFHSEADFFMTDDVGNYRFDPTKLTSCHDLCFKVVKEGVFFGVPVIVSNTFVRRWEMKRYESLAKSHGYDIQEIICRGSFDNIHNVPDWKVKQMQERFEF